jgi:hypothetical protein
MGIMRAQRAFARESPVQLVLAKVCNCSRSRDSRKQLLVGLL